VRNLKRDLALGGTVGDKINLVEDYGWNSAERGGHTQYTTPKFVALLKRHKVKRLLDLGCGNGSLCQDLAQAGFEAVGIEYDLKGVEIARQNFPEVRFYHFGIQDDPQEVLALENGKKFDAVVSSEVVEHLFSPHLLPIYARAVLNDGGYLLVSTPYHGYLKNLALSIMNAWDFHHTALWHGGHIKFWSRATLTTLLSENGFDVIASYGVGRLPYLWKSFILLAQRRA
jgi:2-polyprenyl-3-methyl-5-hydroxy-6-metoxy-1,4-benzoquinol methylase